MHIILDKFKEEARLLSFLLNCTEVGRKDDMKVLSRHFSHVLRKVECTVRNGAKKLVVRFRFGGKNLTKLKGNWRSTLSNCISFFR